MSRIYLDHNATSPMAPEVRLAVARAVEALSGNPSSPHQEGRAARRMVEDLREELAGLLGFQAGEIVLTSGGTEANNLALKGMAEALRRLGRPVRLIVSAVEHPSVLEAARDLEAGGTEVARLPVDGEGRVDPGDLRRALRGGAAEIVSIMEANNETGVLQPLEELAAVARERGALFHSDRVQSAGRVANAAGALPRPRGLTACTITSHKLGGPPGIGALAVSRDAGLVRQVAGGPQEQRRRAGTEAALLAPGFAEAIRLARAAAAEAGGGEVRILRDRLEAAILEAAPGARIHGAGAPRLENTCSFHIPGAAGRYLVMQLDLMGIAVSTGSACSSGSARPSHVLLAMGRPAAEARDSVRISLGRSTTAGEIDRAIESIRNAVAGRAGIPGAVPAAETTRST